MASSQTISKDSSRTGERRGCPRQTLEHYAVLVYFEQDNWGKIKDISESGMSFEFARTPSVRQRLTFGFQAMGCMPVPPDGGIFSKPVEVVGEIIWTQDFERAAGARFLKVAPESREQIRQWLSFEASSCGLSSGKEAKLEEQALSSEPFAPAPLATHSETPSKIASVEPRSAPLEAPGSLARPQQGLESLFAEEIPEATAIGGFDLTDHAEQEALERKFHSNPLTARRVLLGATICAAVLGVAAVARWNFPLEDRRAEAVETLPASPARPAERAGMASDPSAAAKSFQVEVLDLSGKRSLLWFVHNAANNGDASRASISAASSTSYALVKKPAAQKQAAPVEKLHAAGTFTIEGPKLGRSGSSVAAANTPLDEALTPPVEFPAPVGEPMGSVLSSHAVPPPAAYSPPVGGEVQQARLIRSVPPAYPVLARANHVGGDVIVDALINADGNVTGVKVISGPALLQQAAVASLLQWKYEPARLDGQPVAMHLTVTIKFQIH